MTTHLTVVSEAGPHRQCRECKSFRPVDTFELRAGEAGYFGPEFASVVCFTCRQRVARYLTEERQSTASEERRQQLVKQVVQKLRGDGLVNAPHITELSHEVFGAIGGVKRFAQDFKRLYETTMQGLNLRAKMDMSKVLVKLSEASTEHRPSAPDLHDVSDEELAAVLKRELEGYLPDTMLLTADESPSQSVAAS